MSLLDKLTEIGRAEPGMRLRALEKIDVEIGAGGSGVSVHLSPGTLVEVVESEVVKVRGVADLGTELMFVTINLGRLYAFERAEEA